VDSKISGNKKNGERFVYWGIIMEENESFVMFMQINLGEKLYPETEGYPKFYSFDGSLWFVKEMSSELVFPIETCKHRN